MAQIFAEDIFTSFYNLVELNRISVQHQDFSPIQSFYMKIIEGAQLTQNQANFILKLLEKYKNLAAVADLDYINLLENLSWKQPFRILDLSKRIYVEQGKNAYLEICLKFPFQLKKAFEDEIDHRTSSIYQTPQWDPEDKVRRLNFYDYNLIALYEFANKHNFEIDDSFMNVLADVEEIWQHADNVVPYSIITVSGVELVNAASDAQDYFDQHKTDRLGYNLLLAKSMGFVLRANGGGEIVKIATSTENSFWVKDYRKFFSIYNQISEKVCIILDRTSNTLQWLQHFVAEADAMNISRDEIKVCFRDTKDSMSGINEWVKLAGVGGKVETGKILIFESKPAKWLFKEEHDVKLLVSNNLYPPTNNTAKDWFNSHPCVIYLGDIKPSEQRGQTIVEL